MFSIMVADDEQLERRVLTSILKKNVRIKEIIEAKNGKEALELNRELNPDIIIMDIKMPGINGIKALELIKKENPNKEIIMLTAYDDFEFI
ncbi:response regulator transcription factor, partial [Clostridium perfringens]|uniref:response regulator transcription factor n=1 Tax=Clostridium perfringens TaxID=1502 RepID=UPI0032DB6BD0